MFALTLTHYSPFSQQVIGERSITFEDIHAPAFRAAVDELRTRLGTRLERPHPYATEHALTSAVLVTGQLGALVNALVATEDENYVAR